MLVTYSTCECKFEVFVHKIVSSVNEQMCMWEIYLASDEVWLKSKKEHLNSSKQIERRKRLKQR